MEGTIGTILLWPIPGFVPRCWLPCEGQTLQVQPYQALYSLLGHTYGGDPGRSFNLPDLRGAVPVGAGPGVPLGNKAKAGEPQVVIQHTGELAAALSKAVSVANQPPVRVQPVTLPPAPAHLALRYIICVEGIYPDRPD